MHGRARLLSFGERLQQSRNNLNLTQQDIANEN